MQARRKVGTYRAYARPLYVSLQIALSYFSRSQPSNWNISETKATRDPEQISDRSTTYLENSSSFIVASHRSN